MAAQVPIAYGQPTQTMSVCGNFPCDQQGPQLQYSSGLPSQAAVVYANPAVRVAAGAGAPLHSHSTVRPTIGGRLERTATWDRAPLQQAFVGAVAFDSSTRQYHPWTIVSPGPAQRQLCGAAALVDRTSWTALARDRTTTSDRAPMPQLTMERTAALEREALHRHCIKRTATRDRAPPPLLHLVRTSTCDRASIQQSCLESTANLDRTPSQQPFLERTATWDRAPAQHLTIVRTTTWDRAPTPSALHERTATWDLAPAQQSYLERTSTWDRAPAQQLDLARTASWGQAPTRQPFLERTATWDRAPPQAHTLQWTATPNWTMSVPHEGKRMPMLDRAHWQAQGGCTPYMVRSPSHLSMLQRTTTWEGAPLGQLHVQSASSKQGPTIQLAMATPRQVQTSTQSTTTGSRFDDDSAAALGRRLLKPVSAGVSGAKPQSLPLVRAGTWSSPPTAAPFAAHVASAWVSRPPCSRVVVSYADCMPSGSVHLRRANTAMPTTGAEARASANVLPVQLQKRSVTVELGALIPAFRQDTGASEGKPMRVPGICDETMKHESPVLGLAKADKLGHVSDGSGATPAGLASLHGHALLSAALIGPVQEQRTGFGNEGWKQLRLVVVGLQGSGKSTLSRALRHLLGGVRVNQDEFSHNRKRAKKFFLAELRKVASDERVPALIVDKINTQTQHRKEIVEAMSSSLQGNVVVMQLRHPGDATDTWDKSIELCYSRIQNRGERHRTLKGDDPQLWKILHSTARAAETITACESIAYRHQFFLDMTSSPAELFAEVICELNSEGLLEGFAVEDLMSENRIMDSLRVAQAAEWCLAEESKRPDFHAGDVSPTFAPPTKPARRFDQQSVWTWEVQLDAPSTAALQKLWNERRGAAPSLIQVGDFHVTLLYLGGGSDDEVASRSPLIGTAEDVARFRRELSERQGSGVVVEVCGFVHSLKVAAVEVTTWGTRSANVYPHITLACAERVPPRASNELLARKAASEDLPKHLGNWLAELGLARYHAALLQWCSDMGAVTPDEIVENAEDAAESIEGSDISQQKFVQHVLMQSAAPTFYSEVLSQPLRLFGHIVGRTRDQ